MAERVQPTAKYETMNGLRLRYLEWGRPDALPSNGLNVVCVHGYTSSAEAFNALARRLQHRAHIISRDVSTHRSPSYSAIPIARPA